MGVPDQCGVVRVRLLFWSKCDGHFLWQIIDRLDCMDGLQLNDIVPRRICKDKVGLVASILIGDRSWL